MADLNCCISTGAISLTASTPRTVIALASPANQRVVAKGLEMTGQANAGGTDTPIKIELLTFASISGGTAGSVTTDKNDGDDGETVQSTISGNYTAEPTYTSGVTVRTYFFSPQAGGIVYWPLDILKKLKGGTGLAIRLTSGQSETVALQLYFTE